MKSIKVLGTGCSRCKQTTASVEKAVEELGLKDVSIEKVEDIEKIMSYDIMSMPAIVVDEVIKLSGHVPSVKEIKELLS